MRFFRFGNGCLRPVRCRGSPVLHLLLLLGIFCCSTAVIFIKMSTVDPFLLAGYRTFFAALLLLPLFIRQLRSQPRGFTMRHPARAMLPAAALAFHFITWNIGARGTDASNATLIVNMAPVAMPFLLFFLMREVVNPREIIGTLLALGGMLLLAGGDYALNRENMRGDVICFVSMLLFALYLSLGRLNRDFPGIWLYLVPVYGLTGAICFVASAATTNPFQVFAGREYLILLALVVVPTIIGHSCLNFALKHLRGQVVSICNLGQVLFASVMAYILFDEVPAPVFYLSAALIVGGAVVAIRAMAAGPSRLR